MDLIVGGCHEVVDTEPGMSGTALGFTCTKMLGEAAALRNWGLSGCLCVVGVRAWCSQPPDFRRMS